MPIRETNGTKGVPKVATPLVKPASSVHVDAVASAELKTTSSEKVTPAVSLENGQTNSGKLRSDFYTQAKLGNLGWFTPYRNDLIDTGNQVIAKPWDIRVIGKGDLPIFDLTKSIDLERRLKDKSFPPVVLFCSGNGLKHSILNSLKIAFREGRFNKELGLARGIQPRIPEFIITKSLNKTFGPSEPFHTRAENSQRKVEKGLEKSKAAFVAASLSLDEGLNKFLYQLSVLYRTIDLIKDAKIKDPERTAKDIIDILEKDPQIKSFNFVKNPVLSPIEQGNILQRFFQDDIQLKDILKALSQAIVNNALDKEPSSLIKNITQNIQRGLSESFFESRDIFELYIDRLKNVQKILDGHYVLSDDSSFEVPALTIEQHNPMTAQRMALMSDRGFANLELAEANKRKDAWTSQANLLNMRYSWSEKIFGGMSYVLKDPRQEIAKISRTIEEIKSEAAEFEKLDEPQRSGELKPYHFQFLVLEVDRLVAKEVMKLHNYYAEKIFATIAGDKSYKIPKPEDAPGDEKSNPTKVKSMKRPKNYVQEFENYIQVAIDQLRRDETNFTRANQITINKTQKERIDKLVLTFAKKVRRLNYDMRKASFPATNALITACSKQDADSKGKNGSRSTDELRISDIEACNGWLIGPEKLKTLLDRGEKIYYDTIFISENQKKKTGPIEDFSIRYKNGAKEQSAQVQALVLSLLPIIREMNKDKVVSKARGQSTKKTTRTTKKRKSTSRMTRRPRKISKPKAKILKPKTQARKKVPKTGPSTKQASQRKRSKPGSSPEKTL